MGLQTVRSSNNSYTSKSLFTKFKLTKIKKSPSTRKLNSQKLVRFLLRKQKVPEIKTKNLVSINFSATSRKQDLTLTKGLKIWKSKMIDQMINSKRPQTLKVRTFSIRPKTKMMLLKPKKLN